MVFCSTLEYLKCYFPATNDSIMIFILIFALRYFQLYNSNNS